MSESSDAHYLSAIIAEIANIRIFVVDHTSASYAEDVKTRYATERAIQNISEAIRNLEKTVTVIIS